MSIRCKGVLFLLLTGFMVFILSCKKNPVEPETPQPGRRDYIWTVDTLNMPMNYIDAVWGASPNDVWAVGAGGTYQDRLLHYDGKTWTTYTKERIWCGGDALFGFSADDIWMGGGAGWLEHGAGIWHYDGTKWSQNYVYDLENSYLVKVQDLWGTSPKNLYASGVIVFKEGQSDVFHGFILHYDGKQWTEIVNARFTSQFLTIREAQNVVYLFSSARPSYEFFEFNGNELTKLYSGQDAYSLEIINDKAYFIIDNSIYTHANGELVKYLSFKDENFGHQIYGRNVKDIFLRMKDGLAHYNGTDIQYLYQFPRNKNISIMKNTVLMENDVFFPMINYDDSINMVLHGKLNE